jgi:hypothetical protein
MSRVPGCDPAWLPPLQEPDEVDAWANLGSACLRTGRHEAAFAAFEHALRVNRSSWRLWSNFVQAAVAVRQFRRAIAAMHSLLDAK